MKTTIVRQVTLWPIFRKLKTQRSRIIEGINAKLGAVVAIFCLCLGFTQTMASERDNVVSALRESCDELKGVELDSIDTAFTKAGLLGSIAIMEAALGDKVAADDAVQSFFDTAVIAWPLNRSRLFRFIRDSQRSNLFEYSSLGIERLRGMPTEMFDQKSGEIDFNGRPLDLYRVQSVLDLLLSGDTGSVVVALSEVRGREFGLLDHLAIFAAIAERAVKKREPIPFDALTSILESDATIEDEERAESIAELAIIANRHGFASHATQLLGKLADSSPSRIRVLCALASEDFSKNQIRRPERILEIQEGIEHITYVDSRFHARLDAAQCYEETTELSALNEAFVELQRELGKIEEYDRSSYGLEIVRSHARASAALGGCRPLDINRWPLSQIEVNDLILVRNQLAAAYQADPKKISMEPIGGSVVLGAGMGEMHRVSASLNRTELVLDEAKGLDSRIYRAFFRLDAAYGIFRRSVKSRLSFSKFPSYE